MKRSRYFVDYLIHGTQKLEVYGATDSLDEAKKLAHECEAESSEWSAEVWDDQEGRVVYRP